MDIYEKSFQYFTSLPSIALWEEAQDLLRQAADGKPKQWLLPAKACEAVGGSIDQSIPVVTALACSHIGILLVDDMLDADPRGRHQKLGAPVVANLASAFQSAALEAIASCDSPPDTRLAALTCMNEMFLSTALGQTWDIQSPTDEASYWRVIKTKSSPFFGAALQIGALAGGAPVDIANRLNELGRLYGEMIQIHDDINDSLAIPANPDWIQGRSPLPILFAKLVDHPERARFLTLYDNINSPDALQEAQEILIRCGAVSFCVEQLLRHHRSALAMMNAVALVHHETLGALFHEVILPVQQLLERIGESQPAVTTRTRPPDLG